MNAEGNGAAQLVGHVGTGPGIAAHDPGPGDVGFHRNEDGAVGVGDEEAGLRDQCTCDGGTAQVLARLRAHRTGRSEVLCEGLPDGIGEVAAEPCKAEHDVLRAVESAWKRRHQRHCCDDAHDLPAAKSPAALPGRVDGAGNALVDQQRSLV